MEFQITTQKMRSFEDLGAIRRVREATARIWLPGDPPPRITARPAAVLPQRASPRPAASPSPAARAYLAGIGEAHANALACLAVCREFGRPDLIAEVVGMSPSPAKQYVIDAMWQHSFAKARATESWMVR